MGVSHRIAHEKLVDFLDELASSFDVYVPYSQNKRLYLGRFDRAKSAEIDFSSRRSSEPVKTFLVAPIKKVSSRPDNRPLILAGVKACDLASLGIQDFVFGQKSDSDPFYVKARERLVLFSFDCTEPAETCFCTAMGGNPYAQSQYDLNFSSMGGFFIVEAGSPKGQKLLDEHARFFTAAVAGDDAAQKASRQTSCSKVNEFVSKRGTPDLQALNGAVARQYESQLWKDFYATCVECGACNLACPTCHCFLLFDKTQDNRAVRFMEWDSCLYSRFARVAGGGNPRKQLWQRLRNRLEKKFDYFPKVAGMVACTGCGRCVEACLGKIDIREILKGLVNGRWNNPPND